MAARKSGLGRGLGALIPSEYDDGDAGAGAGRAPLEVPIADVHPNRLQPRSTFDEEALAGLTASIAELGVLQPVLVRRDPDGGYELIAGERRWRASKRAGLQVIPVVIRETDSDVSMLEEALVENLHRQDLNALEEAAAYQQLIDDFGLTQDAVAKRVGKSRAAISNTLRLFQLPPAVQSLIAEGRISAGHARAVLAAADRETQLALAARIVDEGLSVREIERIVRGDDPVVIDDAPAPAPEPEEATPARAPVDDADEPGFLELANLLSDHLDTRVSVSGGRSGKGRIVVEFADLEDLERIYRAMT